MRQFFPTGENLDGDLAHRLVAAVLFFSAVDGGSGFEHAARIAPVQAPAKVRPPSPAPRPAAPVLQAKLVVGASDDRYEREADSIADLVMAGMSQPDVEGGGAMASAPTTRISRMTTRGAQRAASVIGAEGGAVDSVTERDISSARSGGRALDGKIRRRMEGAMGADFSNVRVHVGAKSDDLNSRIQAKAFTTGSDIFIRQQDHCPGTASGQRLLAHELAHTVQQGASKQTAQRSSVAVAHSVQRSSAVIQRWDWWEKRKQAKADAAIAEKAEQERAAVAAKEKAASAPYSGNAAKKANTKVEAAKPGTAVGLAGLTAGLSAISSSDYSGPAGGAVLGPVLLADAAMGLYGAHSMSKEAAEHGDAGMAKMAGRKGGQMGSAAGSAALSTAQAGVGIGNVAEGGAKALGGTALGVAGGALGIGIGSAQVIQGVWRGGHAAMKLCRLTWGRASALITERGKTWKKHVLAAEQFKLAINGFKIALGVLGIAAGALLIVSNPIGWAIGIAGAIAGGVYAVSKIAAKVMNTKEIESAGISRQIDSGKTVEDISDSTRSRFFKVGKAREKKGTGASKAAEKDADGNVVPESKRKAAIAEANRVARLGSKNAAIAHDMRDALSYGDLGIVQKAIDFFAADEAFNVKKSVKATDDRYLYDAIQVLSAINVSHEEAMADSGQDLIQQKLSKAEAM